MISLEQIADIDLTITAAKIAYPGARFLHVGLDTVQIEDTNDDIHIFDVFTHEEMTRQCGNCGEYLPDSDFIPETSLDSTCYSCARNRYFSRDDDPDDDLAIYDTTYDDNQDETYEENP